MAHKTSKVVSAKKAEPSRSLWYVENVDKLPEHGQYETPDKQNYMPATIDQANLIGSKTTNGHHMPVIDIDGDYIKLVPSSTPGHYHMYIDKEMTWTNFATLLKVFRQTGIIQEGWFMTAYNKGCAFVRPPWLKKGEKPKVPWSETKMLEIVSDDQCKSVLAECGLGSHWVENIKHGPYVTKAKWDGYTKFTHMNGQQEKYLEIYGGYFVPESVLLYLGFTWVNDHQMKRG